MDGRVNSCLPVVWSCHFDKSQQKERLEPLLLRVTLGSRWVVHPRKIVSQLHGILHALTISESTHK